MLSKMNFSIALLIASALGANAFSSLRQSSLRGRMMTMSAKEAFQLVLLRHGESTWNKENKFTGWYDCPLSEKGHAEAAAAGALLKEEGFTFDIAYTSYLRRAIRTLWHALEQTELMHIPIVNAWELNER
jgi:2,3-bisphosphoglycerate-dependent phosphoglycerate mutase